jgi:4-amino-4-deoxy-L-arabinose transferase-like glycosyltransferase
VNGRSTLARGQVYGQGAAPQSLGSRRWSAGTPVALALQIAIGFLFALWGALHLHGYTYTSAAWIGPHGWSDYDEGVYLVAARLLNQGFPIFTSVFSSQPPLFLAGLALCLRLFHEVAGAGFLYSLFFGLLALAGVAWLSWEAAGAWSATLAVLVLALSPGFVIAAHAVEAEAPMMGLATLSAAASARYARTQHRGWLVFASFLMAAATLEKLLGVFNAAPEAVAIALGALATAPGIRWQRLWQDTVLAALCAALPVLATLLLISPVQQFDQIVRFHTQASKIPGLADPAGTTYSTFLSWDPGLLALAACGLAAALVGRKWLYLIPAAWLVVTVGSTALYYPLFIHHLTVLLPPLAVLAGGAAAVLYVDAARWARITTALLLVAGLLAYLIWLPATGRHAATTFVRDTNGIKAAQIAWLDQHSSAGAFVVTDNQVLAVAANRLVPPPLADTSTVRSRAGYLPLALLERETADPRVQAVLLTRALQYNPPYVAWLQRTFHQVSPPGLPGLFFTR